MAGAPLQWPVQLLLAKPGSHTSQTGLLQTLDLGKPTDCHWAYRGPQPTLGSARKTSEGPWPLGACVAQVDTTRAEGQHQPAWPAEP